MSERVFSFKEVTVTFYDLKTGEEVASFDTMGIEVNSESLIEFEFDKIRGEIMNDGYWLPPLDDTRSFHPMHNKRYDDEYIITQIELGKFKAKNIIDVEDWLESFNRMRNGVTIGKEYYDERSVDNWKGRL